MRAFAILLLVSASRAAADPGAMPTPTPTPIQGGGFSSGENRPDDDTGGPGAEHHQEITVEDARVNFASLVEAFVARQSPDGYWPLRDKKTGQRRRLRLVSVDPKGVKDAGGGKFKGPALLRDLNGGKTLKAEFVVDLSGAEWKVVGLKLLATPAPAGSARRAPPPAEPEPAE